MADVQTARRFRVPLGQRILSLLVAIILVFVTLFFVGIAGLTFVAKDRATAWTFAIIGIAGAGLMWALTAYVLRDLFGKLGFRVVLDDKTVALDLPAGRSLIHRPPAQHLTVPFADIAAIEARYEAYRSLGMATLQRAYVLCRKGGDRIFLFEERAQATIFASSLQTIVDEIAARSKVAVRELGMVEGKGGLFAAWGTRAPDWSAPPLPRERAQALWRRAAATGRMAMAAASAAPGTAPGMFRGSGRTPPYPDGIYPPDEIRPKKS